MSRNGFMPGSGRITRPLTRPPAAPTPDYTPTNLAGAGTLRLVGSARFNEGGWGLPPNLGTGFSSIWPTFDGSVLPALTYGAAPNSFGMNATQGQAQTLTVENDATNPTGSGKVLRITYPGPESLAWPEVWPDGGGRGPSRWTLASGLAAQNWTELHARMRYALSPNYTQYGPLPSGAPGGAGWVIYDTITATSSTTSTVTQTGKAWATNEHAGRYFLNAARNAAYRIVSNTADTLTVRSDPQFSFAYNSQWLGVTTFIAGATAASGFGYNVGTKSWWPRVRTTAVGSGVVRGQAWSENNASAGGENNFFNWARWDGVASTFGTPAFETQMHDWNGVTTDGQGAIGVGTSMSQATYGYVPRFGGPAGGSVDIGMVKGTFYNVEWYGKLNTPGTPNGIVRCWVDGVLRYESTAMRWFPDYVAKIVNVSGVNYIVPVPVTGAVWDYAFTEPTFGGGYKIPQATQWVDVQAWQCFGKP